MWSHSATAKVVICLQLQSCAVQEIIAGFPPELRHQVSDNEALSAVCKIHDVAGAQGFKSGASHLNGP